MIHTVDKEWGTEEWLVNQPEYCAKYLKLAGGKQCSLHRHVLKKESFFVLKGCVTVQIEGARPERMFTGQSVTIDPGTLHRFGSKYKATIIEIGTHHSDDDVERLEPSGDFLPEKW